MTENPATHAEAGLNIQLLAARLLVIGGGVFWMVAAFAGPYLFKGTSMAASVRTAILPFIAAAVILGIGWVHEHLAAFLLSVASTAVVVWGVLYGWELGVWVVMGFVLIAPMALSALLFLLASRTDATQAQPTPRPLSPAAVRAASRAAATRTAAR